GTARVAHGTRAKRTPSRGWPRAMKLTQEREAEAPHETARASVRTASFGSTRRPAGPWSSASSWSMRTKDSRPRTICAMTWQSALWELAVFFGRPSILWLLDLAGFERTMQANTDGSRGGIVLLVVITV